MSPANLPENRLPDKKVTVTFPAPQVTINVATGAANYRVADTNDVFTALTTKYGFPAANITHLKDQQCTDANIKAGISWLVANSDANGDGIVTVEEAFN